MSTRGAYFRGVARQAPAGAAVLRPRMSPRREPPATPQWTSSQAPRVEQEPQRAAGVARAAQTEQTEQKEKNAAAVRATGVADHRLEQRTTAGDGEAAVNGPLAGRDPDLAQAPMAPGAVRMDAVRAETAPREVREFPAESPAPEPGRGPTRERPEVIDGSPVVKGTKPAAAPAAFPSRPRVIPEQERSDLRRVEPLPEGTAEQEGVPLRFWTEPAPAASAPTPGPPAKAAPTLHIGSIEIEVVPPAPEQAPVAAAPRREPGRKTPLSRGYSRLFGWGQS
ncbi:MAG: hypothetical protein IT165_32445 [Bryobacterales bacterium]|nr:hypothetical protein [Bryobacterales bacterium]